MSGPFCDFQQPIVKDVPSKVLAQYRDAYDTWRGGRDASIARASRPSLEVRTAVEHSIGDQGSGIGDPEVHVIDLDSGVARPGGVRYGTLVHAVLATLPLNADADAIWRIAETQGRIAAASAAEVSSAVETVSAVLGHPLIDAARAAEKEGRCLREAPVTLVRDGVLVEGVVDLAFETDEGMTVIDFKTDRAEGDLLATYRRQVAIYAEAIAQATGRSGRAVLMNV